MNYEERWSRHVKALLIFVEKHGHADVPSAYSVQTDSGTVFLGPWVSKIRSQYRRNKLLPHRSRELEKIPGWYWEANRPGPRVEDGRNGQIYSMLDAGMKVSEVAKSMNLTPQRINQIARGRGK